MPQTGPKRISEDRIVAALKKHAGIYSLAAREVGCDRTNIDQRIKRSPRLQAVCAEIEGQIEDLADAVIVDTINEKQPGTNKPTAEARRMARWLKGHKVQKAGLTLRYQLLDKNGMPAEPPTPVQVQIVYVDGASDAPEDEEIPI